MVSTFYEKHRGGCPTGLTESTKDNLSEPSEKQNLPPFSSKNGKNCGFRGRNHQKSLKTANSVDGIIKKRKKLRIPWAESSEIAENCGFRGQNHQKSLKTANSVGRIIKKRKKPAFPTLGKVRITHFLHFPTLGRSKTPENCVSATTEEQKIPKGEFYKKKILILYLQVASRARYQPRSLSFSIE